VVYYFYAWSRVSNDGARFLTGSGIKGANFRRACIAQTWDEQQERFAEFLLTSLFEIYESWAAEMVDDLLPKQVNLVKQLQFPDDPSEPKNGINIAIKKLSHPESPQMKYLFYKSLTENKNCTLSNIDGFLKAYRMFKEIRNCQMHFGGEANQKAEDAYHAFSSIATPTQLTVKEVPKHYPVIVGQSVKLSLRGVVGFSGIIQKILWTLDAELSRGTGGEKLLINRWTNDIGIPKMPCKIDRRYVKLSGLVDQHSFPRPTDFAKFDDWLRTNNLISLSA
jgi:hypothetical protein